MLNKKKTALSRPKLTNNSNFSDRTGAPSNSSYFVIERLSNDQPQPFKIARVDYGLANSTPMNMKCQHDRLVEIQHSNAQQFHAPESEELMTYGSFIQKETVEVSFP